MKKSTLFITAALAVFAMACSKEEVCLPEQTATSEQTEAQFTVVEESEVSSEEFFASALESLQQVEGVEGIETFKDAFAKAENSMESDDDTKGIFTKTKYKTVKITYTTSDQLGLPVKASALIIYPSNKKMSKVLLINHCTNAGDIIVPTKYTSIESVMAATGALCILPDYIGIGESSSHGELYLNADVEGNTSTDALLALLSYAKKNSLNLSSSYDTYVVGYSQGGAVSLAALREIQSRSKSVQKQIRLKKVICGDGPYDLRCTFDSYLADEEDGKSLGMGAVVVRVINGMFNSYPIKFKKYNYEDFFTPWALSTGVPQAIRDNESDISDMVIKFVGAKLSDIINMDYLNANPKAYQTLLEAMDKQNLCKGWKPVYPLQFFHCNPDRLVPYKNFENAYAGLQNSYVLTPETVSLKYISIPSVQHVTGMTIMVSNFLAGKYF